MRSLRILPLGLALEPSGHPGAGFHACLDDVLALGRELLRPAAISPASLAEMTISGFEGVYLIALSIRLRNTFARC